MNWHWLCAHIGHIMIHDKGQAPHDKGQAPLDIMNFWTGRSILKANFGAFLEDLMLSENAEVVIGASSGGHIINIYFGKKRC